MEVWVMEVWVMEVWVTEVWVTEVWVTEVEGTEGEVGGVEEATEIIMAEMVVAVVGDGLVILTF
jgi:hypothetical protein